MRLFIFFVISSFSGFSQELKEVELSKSDSIDNVQYHYQWESTDGHVAFRDLWLLRNGSFVYKISSNTYNAYSEGTWKLSKHFLTLNSLYKKKNLPITISSRPRNVQDHNVKRIAPVRDLNDSIVSNVFVYINDDSTSCIYGDILCKGEFNQIEKVKVKYENGGLGSEWINVPDLNGLLQITIHTRKSLTNFLVFDSKKFKLIRNKIKLESD